MMNRFGPSLLVLAMLLPTMAAAQDSQFRKPGTVTEQDDARATIDPDAIPLPPPDADYRIVPVPDRNRIIEALGVKENPLNPYQQNTIKGDRPIFDDYFIELSAILDTIYEPKQVPVPVGNVSTSTPDRQDMFGNPRQLLVATTFIPTFSFIKGDTAFMPPLLEFRFTPVFNYTRLETKEVGLVNIDPRKGVRRDTGFVGIQEAFIDYHIRNVSDRFDFDSVRVGVQPINADFRGFLFQDQQLGIRFFGDRANNRYQYNLAYFRRIEKDTNSGLNDLSQSLRRDNIFLANLFVQDLPVPGFTTEFSVIHNFNRETGFHYDKNGFLVRPVSAGDEQGHKYNVTYLGLNGDGHFGKLNLTTSFYYALGNDSDNFLTGQKAKIRATFFAAEPSYDIDFVRLKASFLYQSGDKDPFNKKETGFDAIFENAQFAGSDTSYFRRQSLPLIGGGGLGINTRNGILADLRSSKEEGQSNFINPGLILIGVGADVDILPELRFSTNINKLSFDSTKVLSVLRQEGKIAKSFGYDLSGALTYRPFQTQNIVLRTSGAVFIPQKGFKQLFGTEPANRTFYSVLTNLILSY